jgi:hypothetical protein
MRVFFCLVAISAISAVYIEANQASGLRNDRALLRNNRGQYKAIKGSHSEVKNYWPAWRNNQSDEQKRLLNEFEKEVLQDAQAKNSAKEDAKPFEEEDYFLYYDDKNNNVKYYYPKKAMRLETLSAIELEFFNALGGLEGLINMVGVLVHEHLLLSEKMKDECKFLGPRLAKDLIDFFIHVTVNDGYNLKGLDEAFDQSQLLKRINLNEFIIMVIRSAQRLNVMGKYIEQLTGKLDYIRDYAAGK